MPAPEFDQISKAGRDKLARLLGGPDLALRFWDEVVRPVVDGFDRYAVRPGALFARSSRSRYGAELDRHMREVAKTAEALRLLLDEDTLGHLVLPPSLVLWPDELSARQDRNIRRVRDLKRLLKEIVTEIEIPRTDPYTGQVSSLAMWGEASERARVKGRQYERAPLVHRLDCFLAASVVRWVESNEGLSVKPVTLLDSVFAVLQIGGSQDAFAGNGSSLSAAQSIRDAKARKLIP